MLHKSKFVLALLIDVNKRRGKCTYSRRNCKTVEVTQVPWTGWFSGYAAVKGGQRSKNPAVLPYAPVRASCLLRDNERSRSNGLTSSADRVQMMLSEASDGLASYNSCVKDNSLT